MARKSRPAVNYTKLAGEQPHRRWLPEKHRGSAVASTVLGCLYLLDGLSSDPDRNRELYLAGMIFAHAVGQWRSTACGPRSVAGQGKGYDCEPDGCRAYLGPPGDKCECFRRKSRYNELHDALAAGTNRRCVMIVKHVVIHDMPPGDADDLARLRTGLGALAAYVALTASRKSRHRESTH